VAYDAPSIFLFILIGFYSYTRLWWKKENQRMSIPVIEIPWDARGIFRSRQNRFLGIVDITSPKKEKKKNVKVHVHDPGRLKELLYPENQVLLRRATTTNRKTKWDLIAALYDEEWILTHSGFHRQIAEWVINNPKISPFGKVTNIKPEAQFKESRLDFLLTKKNGKKIWVEVKGCTLAEDGIALFPDAPTERGRRHIQALISAKKRGAESAIMILVFRPDAESFAPNEETDSEFSEIFFKAVDEGVKVYPLLFQYKDEMIQYNGKIPFNDY
jgi:sugar fermentation stimulation protein A